MWPEKREAKRGKQFGSEDEEYYNKEENGERKEGFHQKTTSYMQFMRAKNTGVKKVSKKMKKGVDRRQMMRYYNWAVERER